MNNFIIEPTPLACQRHPAYTVYRYETTSTSYYIIFTPRSVADCLVGRHLGLDYGSSLVLGSIKSPPRCVVSATLSLDHETIGRLP